MPPVALRGRPDHGISRGDGLSTARRAPPYPGLAAYGDDDEAAGLFFGRAAERDLVIANLRAARLTVLHGHSGVGKSSLLRAGVVNRLRELDAARDPDDGEPGTTVVIVDDWSGDPVARLIAQIRALTPGAIGADEPPAAGHRESLLEALGDYRASHHGGVLLIFDQFEECLRVQQRRARELDEIIAMLVGDPRTSVRVLIAVRDDRLGDLDRFGARIPGLLGNMLRLGPLSPDAALEAIEGPVLRYAASSHEDLAGHEVALEAGLAETVRDELVMLDRRRSDDAATSGANRDPRMEPALLQLVMRRLWDEDIAREQGTEIRRATLARLGGADTIIATHLATALDRLPPADQVLADEMLRFLVTPSGTPTCLTARDLSDYTRRPEHRIEALAETLSRPPARILRGTAPAGSGTTGGYELPELLADPALEWRARRRTAHLEARARRLLLGLVAVSAVAAALVAYAVKPGLLQRLDLQTVDARFDVRGARAPDSRIALVTVDDSAFERLRAGGERLPRSTWASALHAIAGAAPRAVAVDVIFSGSGSPSDDAKLIEAIDGPLRDRLVLATDRLDQQGECQLFGRETQTLGDESEPAVAYAGFPIDRGGVIRRIERSVALQPGAMSMDSFAAVTTRVGAGIAPEHLPARAWIDYRGPPGTFPRIALEDVLSRSPAALSQLRGKLVILGNTAAAVDDVHPTAAPGQGTMDGPEIQANAVASALDRFRLRDGGKALDLALIVALGLLPAGLALLMRPRYLGPAALVAAALFCVGAQLAFGAGRVVSVVFPIAALLLATLGVVAALMLRSRSGARAAAPLVPLA